MNNKLTGIILLSMGILIMLFSLYSVYSVFNGITKAYPVLNLPPITLDLSNLAGGDLPPEQKIQVQQSSSDALKTELVGAEVLNEPLNLFAHLLLMGFVLNVGFKTASLGVQFLRPIKVKLKEDASSAG